MVTINVQQYTIRNEWIFLIGLYEVWIIQVLLCQHPHIAIRHDVATQTHHTRHDLQCCCHGDEDCFTSHSRRRIISSHTVLLVVYTNICVQ